MAAGEGLDQRSIPKAYLSAPGERARPTCFQGACCWADKNWCPIHLCLRSGILILHPCRRDLLRFLAFLDEARFPPGRPRNIYLCSCVCLCAYVCSAGLRQQLDDVSIGQCYWLLCGLPPFLRVRELRAKDRGEL